MLKNLIIIVIFEAAKNAKQSGIDTKHFVCDYYTQTISWDLFFCEIH